MPATPPHEKPIQVLTSPYNPLSLARAAWKNLRVLVAVWLTVSVLSAIVVYRLPAVYKAETLILVESQKIPEKLVSSTVNAELQDRIATISEQVLSTTRLEFLVDRYNLYSAERAGQSADEKGRVSEAILDRMRKELTIKLERGWTRNQPGAFRVAYQGPNAITVAAVVNDIGNFFIQENTKTREEQAAGTSDFLKAQLSEAKKNLEDQELKLAAYKRVHPGELPEQENSLLAAMATLRTQMQGNQDAIARAQSNKVMLENTVSASEGTLAMLKQTVSQPGFLLPRGSVPGAPGGLGAGPGAKKESDVLREKLAVLRRRYTDSYPDVRDTVIALAQTLKEEAEQEKAAKAAMAHTPAPPADTKATDSRPDPSDQAAWLASLPEGDVTLILGEEQRLSGLRAQVAGAAKEIETLQAERQKILADMASYQARVDALPVREQEMSGILRDYQISKTNYEQLLTKDLSADMATDMEKNQKAERFSVLDVARVPDKPSKPIRPLWYTAGILAGLLLGLAAAFMQELKRNVVLGEWELAQDVVILARIPLIR